MQPTLANESLKILKISMAHVNNARNISIILYAANNLEIFKPITDKNVSIQ